MEEELETLFRGGIENCYYNLLWSLYGQYPFMDIKYFMAFMAQIIFYYFHQPLSQKLFYM